MKIIAKKEKIKLIVLDTVGNFDNFSNSFYLFLIYMYLKKKKYFFSEISLSRYARKLLFS